MRKLYLIIRSVVLWIASILHFFPACSLLVLLGIFVDPRKNDRPQRVLFRNVALALALLVENGILRGLR